MVFMNPCRKTSRIWCSEVLKVLKKLTRILNRLYNSTLLLSTRIILYHYNVVTELNRRCSYYELYGERKCSKLEHLLCTTRIVPKLLRLLCDVFTWRPDQKAVQFILLGKLSLAL